MDVLTAIHLGMNVGPRYHKPFEGTALPHHRPDVVLCDGQPAAVICHWDQRPWPCGRDESDLRST